MKRRAKYYNILVITLMVGAVLGVGGTIQEQTSALTYQNDTNITFTFQPTVMVELSSGGDLMISGLAPGNAGASNEIRLTAGTNVGSGYTITASAGSTDSTKAYYNTNALKNGSSSIYSLASTTPSTATTVDDIKAGYWGYSYSLDDGTNWQSGAYNNRTSGYAGLPAVNDTAVTIVSESSNSETNMLFKIGAKASSSQTSGTYSNVVNFAVVANNPTTTYTITYYDGDTAYQSSPAPVSGTISSGTTANITLDSTATKSGYMLRGWCYGTISNDVCTGTTYLPGSTYVVGNIGGSATINLYAMWGESPLPTNMQDFTLSHCSKNVGTNGNPTGVGDVITLEDVRDGKNYTVRYINGECWMTQNLRFIGTTLNSTTSNVASTYTASSPYYVNGSGVNAYKSLASDSVCMGTSLTTNNSTYSCMQDSGSASTGVWYNYAAASAGTITGTSNSTAAQYDICPKNWHLPTAANSTSGTDLNKLIGNNTTGWQDSTTGTAAFGAVAGGSYNDGSIMMTNYGQWWSATGMSSARSFLHYSNSNNQFNGSVNSTRNNGYFVRCVRSS